MKNDSKQCGSQAGCEVYSKAGDESILGSIMNAAVVCSEEGMTTHRQGGVAVGYLTGTKDKQPLIALKKGGVAVTARSTIAWTSSDIGREAVLMFEKGDRNKPIIIGFLEEDGAKRTASVELECDNERLVLSAEKEVVVRCGDASITLTRDGKILIRGKHLVSRSTGANKSEVPRFS